MNNPYPFDTTSDMPSQVRGSSSPAHGSVASVPMMHRPIRYYRCPSCNGDFVQPANGYEGLCKQCTKTLKPGDYDAD